MLNIINEGKGLKKDQKAIDAWGEIFGVSSDDKSLLRSRVGQVMALPCSIRSELFQIDDINHDLLLKWLPSIEVTFSVHSFQIQWKQFIDRFNPEVIYGIEVCADALGKGRPGKTADPKGLQELLENVTSLLFELRKTDLPEDLKSFIFEHLQVVKNALEEYKITGIKPLEAEVERLTGVVARRPDMWTRTRDTEIGEKFWLAMGNLAVVTTVVVGSFQIGNEVFDALSTVDQPSPEASTNWDVRVNIYQVGNTSVNTDVSSPTTFSLPPPELKK